MSSNIQIYGDLPEEKRAIESIQSREIVQEINFFGKENSTK